MKRKRSPSTNEASAEINRNEEKQVAMPGDLSHETSCTTEEDNVTLEPTSSETQVKNTFDIMRLPRELRDRIYDFHLEVACSESGLRDFSECYYDGAHFADRTDHSDARDMKSVKGPARSGFFYEPIFIHETIDPKWSQYPDRPGGLDFEAREHPIPALTLLGNCTVAREAWHYYLDRLTVHTDALNRFNAFCLSTLGRDQHLQLRKLYIVTTASYSLKDEYVVSLSKLRQNDQPTFLVQINADRTAITISSRFALEPKAHAIFQSNLKIMLERRLQSKPRVDGRELTEAMFATHLCSRVGKNRTDIVIGPFAKGRVEWPFMVEQAVLDRVSDFGKSEEELWDEAVSREKFFKHVLFRGEAEGTKYASKK